MSSVTEPIVSKGGWGSLSNAMLKRRLMRGFRLEQDSVSWRCCVNKKAK